MGKPRRGAVQLRSPAVFLALGSILPGSRCLAHHSEATGLSVASSAPRPVTQTQTVVIHTWRAPAFPQAYSKLAATEWVSVPPGYRGAAGVSCVGSCFPAWLGKMSCLSLISSIWKSLKNQTKLASLPDLNTICTWGRGKKNYFLLIHATYMKYLAFQSWKLTFFFSVLLSKSIKLFSDMNDAGSDVELPIDVLVEGELGLGITYPKLLQVIYGYS